MKKRYSIVILICVALVGLYVYNRTRPLPVFSNTPAPAVPGPVEPVSTPTTLPPTKLPDGRMQYQNNFFHFLFAYPPDLQLQEYATDNVRTLVLQDPSAGKGFQVLIQPYNGVQITDEQFKKDVPSGIRTNLTSGFVDGAPAAAFYSKDADLGDTYEVWFVHDGYLFEITTLAALDSWLPTIIQSWKFTS